MDILLVGEFGALGERPVFFLVTFKRSGEWEKSSGLQGDKVWADDLRVFIGRWLSLIRGGHIGGASLFIRRFASFSNWLLLLLYSLGSCRLCRRVRYLLMSFFTFVAFAPSRSRCLDKWLMVQSLLIEIICTGGSLGIEMISTGGLWLQLLLDRVFAPMFALLELLWVPVPVRQTEGPAVTFLRRG